MQSSNKTLSRPLGITIFAVIALIVAALYLIFELVVMIWAISDIEGSGVAGLLLLPWGLGLLAAAAHRIWPTEG